MIQVGDKFGMLTVSEKVAGKAVYNCLCDCGNTKTVAGCNLKSKHNSSCGCMRNMHGMRYHPAYKSWLHMKQRCANPKNLDYPKYGGRGIFVHSDFMDSFPKWLEEIGERPVGPRWSIGRKDNNGSYTYGNMRWENDEQQARNHCITILNTSGIVGVRRNTKTIAGKEYHAWVATWASETNKSRTKEFSCNKYGEEEAKRLATEYRENMIKLLNDAGYEYAESHGTKRSING